MLLRDLIPATVEQMERLEGDPAPRETGGVFRATFRVNIRDA